MGRSYAGACVRGRRRGPTAEALDVGCTGASKELVGRLGADSVQACDPSPPFVAACAARNPGVEVMQGRAEELPYESGTFYAVLAQLVMHFVSDPGAAVVEMTRVVKPGSRVAVCVWDFERGMEMLRAFWDAAVALDPAALGMLAGVAAGPAVAVVVLVDRQPGVDLQTDAVAVVHGGRRAAGDAFRSGR